MEGRSVEMCSCLCIDSVECDVLGRSGAYWRTWTDWDKRIESLLKRLSYKNKFVLKLLCFQGERGVPGEAGIQGEKGKKV